MDLSYFKKINNAFGTHNLRDSQLYNMRKYIENSFDKSIDYHEIELRDGSSQGVLITKTKDFSKKTIFSKPSENISLGESFKWNGNYWLITDADVDSQIYHKCVCTLCNYMLNYQNESPEIFCEPCVVTSLQNTSGQSQNSVIAVPDNLVMLMLQYNDNTKMLYEDKRIFLDIHRSNPSVYKITKIDAVTKMNSEHGLLVITCKSDGSYNQQTDNKDLLIADWIQPSDSGSPQNQTEDMCYISHNNGLVYKNTDICSLKAGGSPMPFNAVFKDTDGNIQAEAVPVWSLIDMTDIQESDISITYDDKYPLRVYLQVKNDSALVGATFKLLLTDGMDRSSVLKCRVVSF